MQHIFGHDQIPGVTPANVAGMHWDPGPYWNWERYFQLLGAPLNSHAADGAVDLVRIVPGFDDNIQPLMSCTTTGVPCEPQGTNFVYLHQAPSQTAPYINDIALRPNGAPATTRVSDIGARAQAGLTFAVAERQGDWTAIWFNGVKGWFHNPASDPTAIPVKGSYVVPKAGLAKVPVYGRAYPEASAYPAGIPVQALAPLQYAFTPGQRYAVGDLTVPTNYYRAVTYSLDTPERPRRRRRAGPLLPDLARPPFRLRARGRRGGHDGEVAPPQPIERAVRRLKTADELLSRFSGVPAHPPPIERAVRRLERARRTALSIGQLGL